MKKMLIASDHAGFALKEELKIYLGKLGFFVKDMGTYSTESCDYPVFAGELARSISEKKYTRGILICKSGIGNSIVANRYPGVRAGLCYNLTTARLSREHNDCNVLVLGSAFVKQALAKRILRRWLDTKFAGGRHQRRLNRIEKIEKELGRKRN